MSSLPTSKHIYEEMIKAAIANLPFRDQIPNWPCAAFEMRNALQRTFLQPQALCSLRCLRSHFFEIRLSVVISSRCQDLTCRNRFHHFPFYIFRQPSSIQGKIGFYKVIEQKFFLDATRCSLFRHHRVIFGVS